MSAYDGTANGDDSDMDGDGTPNDEDPTLGGCVEGCCDSGDPCCGVDDPCDPLCGDPCLCMSCDDGDPCTEDECSGGTCSFPDKCPGQECCTNGECCSEPCEGCQDNGTLTGGSIDVSPEAVCLGDTITFTVSGVVDNGGIMREFCTSKRVIDPVTPTYSWVLTLPPGYPEPLPPLTGSGGVATVLAEVPGEYSCTFTAEANRDCKPPAIEIGPATSTAAEVDFVEDPSQTYGFDAYTNRNNTPVVPYKSVEASHADTAILNITPASAASGVHVASSNTGAVTVTPPVAGSGSQVVTVTGIAPGDSTISARAGGPSGAPCATMQVTAYNKRERTVAIILVHEENDDVQEIPVKQGAPNKHAIRVGANSIIDSVPGGDDWIQVVGEPIVVTGLNGICETAAVGDDVQIIDLGNGAPDHLCVGLGDNGFRDTINVDASDTVVADGIGTGPDGICNSVADDTNVLSTDFGTEALIRDYLNTVIYNQAVVWWHLVSKFDPVAANFDLDRNGFLDVAVCDTAEILALTDGVRAKVLAATGEDLNAFDFNVFLVDRPSESLLGTECAPWVFVFVGQHGTESVTKTIAHELGHAQGLANHPDDMGDPDVDNLMHSTSDGEKLRKGQWDDLHTGP